MRLPLAFASSTGLLIVQLLNGCAGSEAGADQRQGLAGSGSDAGLLPGTADAGLLPVTADAGSVDAIPAVDSSVVLDAPPSAAPTGLPCEVAQVVGRHCLSCHGSDLAAPMQLLTHADFTKAAVSAPERKVYELVEERVHDARRPMPPLSASDTLSADEQATLDAWISAGAPETSASCTVTGSDAGVTEQPIDLSECDVLEELRSHDLTDDSKPYAPPAVEDHYQCFNFPVPWDGDVHGLRFDPLLDDKRVVHHWILFSTTDANPPKANGCSDNRLYLSGWAPGPGGKGMPAGVGLQMPTKGQTLQLEVHYNNAKSYPGVTDHSGVRVCATHKLRPNTAAVHWLGSLGIALGPGATNVVNTCTVNAGMGPATVISSWPHMHKLATHMKSEVLRKDGSVDIIVDTAFDFRDQTDHPVTVLVNPGDRLRTTCSYVNNTGRLVLYGEGTEDEMCLNFVTAYPAGALSAAPNNQNRCMGLL